MAPRSWTSATATGQLHGAHPNGASAALDHTVRPSAGPLGATHRCAVMVGCRSMRPAQSTHRPAAARPVMSAQRHTRRPCRTPGMTARRSTGPFHGTMLRMTPTGCLTVIYSQTRSCRSHQRATVRRGNRMPSSTRVSSEGLGLFRLPCTSLTRRLADSLPLRESSDGGGARGRLHAWPPGAGLRSQPGIGQFDGPLGPESQPEPGRQGNRVQSRLAGRQPPQCRSWVAWRRGRWTRPSRIRRWSAGRLRRAARERGRRQARAAALGRSANAVTASHHHRQPRHGDHH